MPICCIVFCKFNRCSTQHIFRKMVSY